MGSSRGGCFFSVGFFSILFFDYFFTKTDMKLCVPKKIFSIVFCLLEKNKCVTICQAILRKIQFSELRHKIREFLSIFKFSSLNSLSFLAYLFSHIIFRINSLGEQPGQSEPYISSSIQPEKSVLVTSLE
jgi:hypothetical protein